MTGRAPSERLHIQPSPAATAEGHRDTTRAEALAELSGQLAAAGLEPKAVSKQVAKLVAGFLGDTAVVRLVYENSASLQQVAFFDADVSLLALLRKVITETVAPLDAGNPYSRAFHSGRTVLIDGDDLAVIRAVLTPAARAAFDTVGVTSVLVAPMRARGKVVGTLGLWRRAGRPAHSVRDQQFVQELADRSGLAIDGAKLVDQLRTELNERKQAEESLKLTVELMQRLENKRHALVESMIHAQEQERKRIAAEVHDDSIQAMAAAGIRMQTLRRRLDDPALVQAALEIEELVGESIRRLRNLLFQLDPAGVEQVGLGAALHTFMEHTFRDTSTVCQVQGVLTHEPPKDLRLILYRIAQEALTNVRKHAEASHVRVNLAEDERGYTVTVHDDGRGFDPSDERARYLPGHLGMRGMADRAQLGDGNVLVESIPGQGTAIRIWVPHPGSEVLLEGHQHHASPAG